MVRQGGKCDAKILFDFISDFLRSQGQKQKKRPIIKKAGPIGFYYYVL
jgi:hypothetical protein